VVSTEQERHGLQAEVAIDLEKQVAKDNRQLRLRQLSETRPSASLDERGWTTESRGAAIQTSIRVAKETIDWLNRTRSAEDGWVRAKSRLSL